MFKKIWQFMSLLGVRNDMALYRQKSIILFNQIIRVLILILLVITSILYFIFHIKYSLLIFLIGFLIVALSLFFNLKGKIETSLFLVSFTLPILVLTAEMLARRENGTNSLVMYLVPRIGIIITTLIPIAIGGFKSKKSGILGGLFGAFIFIAYDPINRAFGVVEETMVFYHNQLWLLKLGLTLFFIFSVVLILFLQDINFAYEKLVSKQNEEIISQRDSLFAQNEMIAKQQQKTTDSLKYAQKIQMAILPPIDSINRDLGDFFLVFRPKDIVSGDFYWKRKIGQTIYLAVADCTGHGVPGGFMSMLNLAFLNDIVNQNRENGITAAAILNKTRELVKKSLRQERENQSRDGMDISLCVINSEKNEINFAGANNDIIYFENGELFEIKDDRQPIGIHRKEQDFSDKWINTNQNQIFYLFSDGFPDQLGGPEKRKYMKSNFKRFLKGIQHLCFVEQKSLIEQEIEQWINFDTHKMEQVDDITIMGFKI